MLPTHYSTLLIPLVLLAAFPPPTRTQCTSDHDCTANTFCVNKQCAPLASTGEFCTYASDCASYPVLGMIACSGACNMVSACGPVPASDTCCLGVPLNSTCDAHRQLRNLNQCEHGLLCLPTSTASTCTHVLSNKWLVGLVICISGSIILNIGMNIQKFAFRKNECLPELDRKPAHRLPLWVFGFTVWIVGNLANFVALSFAAQSLVASLGAISLVSNAIAAPIINKEPFGVMDLVSILFIGVGTIVVVIFSNRNEASYSLCALLRLYMQPAVLVYLCVVGCLIIGIWVFMNIMHANQARFDSLSTSSESLIHLRIAVDKLSYVQQLMNHPRFFVSPNSSAIRVFLPFSYACMGGTLGGLTVMFAKSAAALISLTFQGDNQFVFPPTYAILCGIIVTGIGQVYYINQGLKRYDALLQVPCFYVVYTLSSIVSGGVYFSEFDSFSSFQFIMFITGVSLTFIGVACLTGRLSSPANPVPSSVENMAETSYALEPNSPLSPMKHSMQDALLVPPPLHHTRTYGSTRVAPEDTRVDNRHYSNQPLLHIHSAHPDDEADQLPGSVPTSPVRQAFDLPISAATRVVIDSVPASPRPASRRDAGEE